MTIDLPPNVEYSTTQDCVNAELADVSGDICGFTWTCASHTGGPVCLRATNHSNAEILIDVHIGRDESGNLVQFVDCCSQ